MASMRHRFSQAPNSYHLNTFGGQMGGPVRIPHLYDWQDKTFFESAPRGHITRRQDRRIFLSRHRQNSMGTSAAHRLVDEGRNL